MDSSEVVERVLEGRVSNELFPVNGAMHWVGKTAGGRNGYPREVGWSLRWTVAPPGPFDAVQFVWSFTTPQPGATSWR